MFGEEDEHDIFVWVGFFQIDFTGQGFLEKKSGKKLLPRSGIESGFLRPQLNVLTIRPPKRLPLYNLLLRLSSSGSGTDERFTEIHGFTMGAKSLAGV